jgi:hypothetical protein
VSFDANGLGTTKPGTWPTYTFSSSARLVSGNVYAICLITTGTDANRVKWPDDVTSPTYANGSYSISNGSDGANGTWGNDTGKDFMFETYGDVIPNAELTGTVDFGMSATGTLTSSGITPTKINLIPFTYSSDTTYMMEFGNEYIRFYYGDAVLQDGSGNDVWLTTPYQTADLYNLQFKQVGDVMRITHPAYQTRTLRRTSVNSFDLQVIPFGDGPFLVRHDIDSDDGMTLTSSVSGALNGTVSYSLGPVDNGDFTISDTVSDLNHIMDNWWDGNAAHAIGSSSDYCGGGRKSDGRRVWITYTIDLPSPIASLTTIDLTYMCMSHDQTADLTLNTHTKRGLRLYNGSWNVIYDPTTNASSDFPATGYTGDLATLVGYGQTKTLTFTAVTNVTKIEITLYAIATAHSTACALFNVAAGTSITGRTGTLTSSGALFEAGHVGSLFYLVQPRLVTTSYGSLQGVQGDVSHLVSLCGAINVKNEFRITTSGNWSGTIYLQRREDSLSASDWENFRVYTSGNPPDLNVNQPFIEDRNNVEYRVMCFLTTAASSIHATIAVTDSTQTGIVRIDAVESSTVADITVITPVASTDPTKRWAEGAWSGVRGYPMSCCFIEERCCYLGLNLQTSGATLLKVWLSHSGDYDSFEAGVNAADSFELTIPTTNAPAWIEAMDNLTVATERGTWFIRSNKIDSPLIPVPSPIVRQQSGYTCDAIRPVDVGKAMVYVSGRQVRELGYDNNSKENDVDLTVLAEHFTESPIVGVSIQYHPYQILWFFHEDYTASILAYDKEQNHYGWSHIDVDGEVQSICVTPGDEADDIWVAVKRTINSADVIYIEKIKPQFINADTLIEDLFYVDSGITYDDVATNTISSLNHLEGETVVALCSTVVDTTTDDPPVVTSLGNGVVYTGLVVSGGTITLPATITVEKAQIGFAYSYTCEPERIVTQSPRGTTLGSTITFNKFTISFLNTMKAKAGAISTDLRDFDWSDPKFINNSEVTGLFSGDIDGIRDGTYNSEAPIIIGGNDPLPCTIRALIPRLEVTGS